MTATPVPLAVPPATECPPWEDRPEPFSLFEGDRLRRLYDALGMGPFVRWRLTLRALAFATLTYAPMALLAWLQGLTGMVVSPTNFFADFAAYAQFLLALPLYLFAEPIVDASTREAARQFLGCGLIRLDDRPKVEDIHATIRRARLSPIAEGVLVAVAFAFSLAVALPHYLGTALPTWHVHSMEGIAFPVPTAPGFWLFAVALPLLNYIWLRMIWKIVLWTYYLRRIARLALELHPTHPDATGGIGFVSETQGRFAVCILAFGIGNVAAPVGYQIAVLNYDFWTLPVFGPLVLFCIGAPLLFTLPLLMFTRQLFRSRRRALRAYRERVTEHSRRVEEKWLFGPRREPAQEELRELAELATLGAMFSRIEDMRVVPFDLRSFGQLVGSTLGAIATLLPLVRGKGDVASIFEAIARALHELLLGK
jgi:hypothetical protein